MAAVKGSFAAEISLLSSPNSYVHWTILQYTRQQFDVRACWSWPLWHEQKFTWQLGSDQSTGSQVRHISSTGFGDWQVHRFCISAVQVLVFDRFTGSAYQQYRCWWLTGSQVLHISSEYWFLYLTGPQVRQYSTYQGGRTGQGKEVVASFR